MRERDEVKREKAVTMPRLEEMTKRIEELGLWGKTREGDEVFQCFTRAVANKRQTGTTLVIAWEQACENALRGFPLEVDLAITRLLTGYVLDQVVEAVTPDKTVATDAKEEWRFLKEIRS